jgi:NTE family protein
LVSAGVPWQRLHENTRAGNTHAVIVAALNIATGQTTMFAETAPNATFRPSNDPHRRGHSAELGPEHVLGSAALPVLFPARRIGDNYYSDGGLRFNTPIAPAIRAGSERIIVVPTLFKRERPNLVLKSYPSPTFLAGKLVNALIADRFEHDLQMLDRFNRLVDVLESVVDPDDMRRVDEVLLETRGASYRKLETLVFRPSEDIGLIAGNHIRERVTGPTGWLFRRLLRQSRSPEADWGSYVLFDGNFAATLIELGRRDAIAREQEIRRFLDS